MERRRIRNMKKILTTMAAAALTLAALAQAPNPEVKKVHIIFKTHLDIGFTDLSSKVEQKYIDEFIPKALAVAEELRKIGAEERYVWTTGAWLVDAYLKQASPDAVKELKEAIERGDIVWNGVPYTVESESLNKAMFAEMLNLSAKLDQKFGKKTIAAKMTDVPGHTRSIVPILADAGMIFLHIGVNSAATVPDVPPVCVWKDLASGKDVMLMYQKTYGEDMILPGGEIAVSINFTNDNHGPHTLAQVKDIYRTLRVRYPNAKLEASSLNNLAEDLLKIKKDLPVVTSEIGDTWIYGYGSSPVRMAEFRALSRLFSHWLEEGKLEAGSDVATEFAIRLGMIGEHTWGMDTKTFLRHYDIYDLDKFNASRSLPEFQLMEQSWKELDENIGKAIAQLPENLQAEALEAIEPIKHPEEIIVKGRQSNNPELPCTIAYQSFSQKDYDEFHDAYLRKKIKWALEDNGKPGIENSEAKSATLEAKVIRNAVKGNRTSCEFGFPASDKVNPGVLPERVAMEYITDNSGKKIELRVAILDKPANRMPEAYWLSFNPGDILGVVAEKTGSPVDLMDVVSGGNRQMHGIDRYVDIKTSKGTYRISSYDAPLLSVGERDALNYSTSLPDLSQGVHFCLYNNLWGTNFSMWWEGSIVYRFTIELL